MSELTDLVDFIAPNLVSDTTRRDTAIDMATRFVGATSAKWGSVWNDAIANLAAHLLAVYDPDGAISGSGGGAGPITQQKTGDWSVSYAAPSSSGGATSDGSLSQTPWGREYLRLRNSRAKGKMTVIQSSNDT